MTELHRFHTLGGDWYQLSQESTGWWIRWPSGGASGPHHSRAKALFTLGGMVDWTRWTAKSLLALQHLNHGKAI